MSVVPTDPEAIRIHTMAHMAYEAYLEGLFEEAVERMREYLELLPEDTEGRLALGNYLSCAGRLGEALDAYGEYARLGGDAAEARRQSLRAVAADTPEIADAPLIDPRALAARAAEFASCRDLAPLEDCAQELAEEWNFLRRGCEQRLRAYREEFEPDNEYVDVCFVVMPMLQFVPGYPPHGVTVLQEFLKKRGCRSRVLDFNLALHRALPAESHALWDYDQTPAWRDPYRFRTGLGLGLRHDLETLASIAARARARLLGFGCFHINRRPTLDILPRIKSHRPDCFIALGGADCFYPEQCRTRYASVLDQIDAFVVGEGEIALAGLLEALAGGGPLPEQLPGLMRPETWDPEAFRRALPVPVSELKGFPRIDARYLEHIPGEQTHVLATNRGCVNKCDFCYDTTAWQKFRFREPEDIADEIRYYYEQHGIRNFHVGDSATNGSPKYLHTLCDTLIDRLQGLEPHIKTSVLVQPKMTLELFKKMRRAGFRTLFFGIESGSEAVLNAMRKQGGAEGAARNLRLSHEAGIENRIFMIVGHPAEGPAEFKETLEWLRANRRYIQSIDMINTCGILLDTALARKMEAEGVAMPEGWTMFSSWTLGDNNILERIRRQNVMTEHAAELGIACGCAVDDSSLAERPRENRPRKFLDSLKRIARRRSEVSSIQP